VKILAVSVGITLYAAQMIFRVDMNGRGICHKGRRVERTKTFEKEKNKE
jgi:hypothetical protein